MRSLIAVWVVLLALGWAQQGWAQQATTDTSAATVPDSAANFQIMFLAEPGDTLVFTREEEEEYEEDSIEVITEAVVNAPAPSDSFDYSSFIPGTPADLVEDRLACLASDMDMPLTYNKTVNSFINFFVVRKRNYTQTMLERKDYYFPIFEEALRRYDLPDELKYLAIVESGLNMRALSKSGAVGLWQFMGPTGRDFKLMQDKYTDDRMDPHRATEAACRYLRFLYNQFSDWELALAAYNCGPGAIRRVMNRTGGRTFWEIYNALPQETRSYVPQFTAVVYAMNYAEQHNLFADADSMLVLPKHDTITLDRQLSLAALSEHLQVPAHQLVLLNPSLRRPVSPEAVPFMLNLPEDAAERFRAERQCYLENCKGEPIADAPATGRRSRGRTAEGELTTVRKRHTVRRGESLFAIASKFDVTVSELKRWNHLRSSSVKPGQKLTVAITRVKGKSDDTVAKAAEKAKVDSTAGPSAADMPPALAKEVKKRDRQREKALKADSARLAKAVADSTATVKATAKADAKAMETILENGQKVYEVQPGDTLWNISRRYQSLSVEQIMKLNNLKDKNLKPGMRLIVG